jgi:hypothetical protein
LICPLYDIRATHKGLGNKEVLVNDFNKMVHTIHEVQISMIVLSPGVTNGLNTPVVSRERGKTFF